MQSVKNVLIKFGESAISCNKSDLRKIKSFANAIRPKIMSFKEATGCYPTKESLEKLIKDVDLYLEHHESNHK